MKISELQITKDVKQSHADWKTIFEKNGWRFLGKGQEATVGQHPQKDMHNPFVGMGRNESAKLTEDIFRFIKTTQKVTKKSLFVRFYQSLKTPDELNRVLDDLITMDRITRVKLS